MDFYDDLKRTHEQLFQAEKLAYVGQLASSVVHEIRNPLTAIKTFIESIPAKYNDEGFREKFARLVPAEVRRIEGIVTQLLDIARPKVPGGAQVNIVKVIDGILELLENNMTLKGIQLQKIHAQDCIKVKGGEEQLRQAFLNLILNSLQAIGEGGKLTVQTRIGEFSERGKKAAEILISDTGAGISEENFKKLFTPFHTTKKGGVGLGLVITKEIIEAHGGTISVESEVGKGTKFVIELPAG